MKGNLHLNTHLEWTPQNGGVHSKALSAKSLIILGGGTWTPLILHLLPTNYIFINIFGFGGSKWNNLTNLVVGSYSSKWAFQQV